MHKFEYFHFYDHYVKIITKMVVETIREKVKANLM